MPGLCWKAAVMDAFELSDVLADQKAGGWPYHEFFRVPDLSMGIYALAADSEDKQQPHGEDEIYIVAEGRGSIFGDGEDRERRPGSSVYVAKHLEHRFHSITEDLSLLVFFAPAEGG